MSKTCGHLTCRWLAPDICGIAAADLERDARAFGIERAPGESDRELLRRAMARARKDRTLLAALAAAKRGDQ